MAVKDKAKMKAMMLKTIEARIMPGDGLLEVANPKLPEMAKKNPAQNPAPKHEIWRKVAPPHGPSQAKSTTYLRKHLFKSQKWFLILYNVHLNNGRYSGKL